MEGGCCCARHPAMHSRRRTGASAACAARENGFGVIVPGARVVRESPGDASPENVLLYRRPVNTYRAVQRARHLQGLPIAISIAHHTSLDGALSEAPRSIVGVVLSETPPLGPEKTRETFYLLPKSRHTRNRRANKSAGLARRVVSERATDHTRARDATRSRSDGSIARSRCRRPRYRSWRR